MHKIGFSRVTLRFIQLSSFYHRRFGPAILIWVLFLSSCQWSGPRVPEGHGPALDWADVPGWKIDRHSEAWPALLNNCRVVSERPEWKPICAAAENWTLPDDQDAREFFETWFMPHQLFSEGGNTTGLVTGYYEPLLHGSMIPDDRFRFPIYRQPDALLIVDLGDIYPDLKGKRVRGRIVGNKVKPFFSREEIEADRSLMRGEELLWVDNRDDVFFLHIQGSGRVQLQDGKIVGVGYANQNGHPYVSIGRVLLNRKELAREDINLFTIRQWLDDHPDKAEQLLNENPSYVFFTLKDEPQHGPVGSLNVPLTPERSLAIDPKKVTLGTPVWLMTNEPGSEETPYQRLVFAQDTGGAIKGVLRGDLFWGHGNTAEQSAGVMKEKGEMIVLLPKPVEGVE